MENPKTFLLVMPDYSDFPDLFLKNLEQSGFKAFLITDKINKFKYKGYERLVNFYKKTFFRDYSLKKELVENFTLNEYSKKTDKLPATFDYILVIRPDQFPIPFIQNLKNKTSKLIAYQWDGIAKFPDIKYYYSFFDSFYCFENVENVRNIKKITNFYFDLAEFRPSKDINTDRPPVFYFVGLDWENRREMIDKFVEFAVRRRITLDFYMQEFEKNNHKNPHIKYIKDRITFAENLEHVKNADVLLDFVDSRHAGLSIRFFEGLYYKKKVITDNKMVKNYDFYHPNNIFVLDGSNYDLIEDFLNLSYHEMSEEIVKKYSFSSWIKEITKN